MLVDQPFQERPGRVQGKGDLGIIFEHVQEGAIAGAIGLLEDPVEIAHGLVVMQARGSSGPATLLNLGIDDGPNEHGERWAVPTLHATNKDGGRCPPYERTADSFRFARPRSKRPGVGSGPATSTSRKKPAAFSGGTGLM